MRDARADVFLVEQGYANSRSEAQAAIQAGLGARQWRGARPSRHRRIAAGAVIDMTKPHPYVSRGGVKLAAALDHFDLSPEGRICLDIGASTGGFTEVLLAARRGPASMRVDVGHGQMHQSLTQRSARERAATASMPATCPPRSCPSPSPPSPPMSASSA